MPEPGRGWKPRQPLPPRLFYPVLVFNPRDDQKDVQELSKNGDSQPRQTSRVFGNQHRRPIHRPRLQNKAIVRACKNLPEVFP